MRCPYCKRPGLKRLKGYCSKAHYRLAVKPKPKNIPCKGCGEPQRRVPSTIAKSGNVYCKRCKRSSGENHYKWKDGGYVDRAGYRMILIDGYYYREHRRAWEKANLACLLTTGTIHHIRIDLPFNKVYNEPDNLLLLSDEEHGRFHRFYDNEKYDQAFEVLYNAAKLQLHYPKEIDNLKEIVFSTKDCP